MRGLSSGVGWWTWVLDLKGVSRMLRCGMLTCRELDGDIINYNLGEY